MRFIFSVLLAMCSTLVAAQTVNIFGGLQPSGGPVATSSTNNHILSFAMYRNTGDPATNLTAAQVTMSGTVQQANWSDCKLYEDTNTNGQLNIGTDTLISTSNTTLAGKIVFSGLGIAVPEGFAGARGYFITIDVGSAGAGETVEMEILAADLALSAGTASGTTGQSNLFTIKVDTGTEIDVSYQATSIPSSLISAHDVGYVQPYVVSPPSGGDNLTFRISNTSSTASLTLNSVQVLNVVNGTATLLTSPPASVGTNSFTDIVIQVRPASPTTFSFLLKVGSSDFDEDPYNAAIVGTGVPQAKLELSYSATPVSYNSDINEGSQTAAVAQTMSFTITNAGTAQLDLTGSTLVVANDGPNVSASVTTQPASPNIAVSASGSFVVEYTPIGGGSWGFNIQIASNDPVHAVFVVSVSGTSPSVTASEMRVFTQPAGAEQGQAFDTSPVVVATSSTGAVDTNNNTLSVTVSITGGTGDPGGALVGTITRTAINGYVTFTGLGIDTEANGYTLTFTDDSSIWTAVISNTVDVGPPPPAPPSGGDSGDDEDEGGCVQSQAGTSVLLLFGLLALIASRAYRRVE